MINLEEKIKALRGTMSDTDLRKKIGEEFGLKKTARNERFNKIFGIGTAQPKACKKKETGLNVKFSNETGEVDYTGDRILTLEQLLDKAGVDTDIWEVEKHIINKWEVARKNKSVNISWSAGKADGYVSDAGKMTVNPLFQVKVWLKKKVEAVSIKKMFEKFLADSRRHAPFKFEYNFVADQDRLMVFNIQDLHIGKLAWGKETNGEDWDLNIAKEVYKNAVAELASRAEDYNTTDILLIVGSDFFHVDTPKNTTTAGTIVDTDTRWTKSFSEGCDLLSETIEQLGEKFRVHVVCIPGNHDETKSFYLGSYLQAWFRNHANVFIDNEPKSRKYFGFGKNLVGFTHGSEEKLDDLPLIMMRENQGVVSDYKYQFFLTGHRHTDSLKEIKGVKVMVAPALCANDKWHSSKGYVGNIRTSQGLLFSKDSGLEAIFYTTPVE